MPATLLAALCALLLTCTALTAACGNNSPSTVAAPSDSQIVTFTTTDGIQLSGHLFGSGTSGVVLAHMYPADQTSWYATAEKLAGEGYLVLSFDFRGYGDSGGSKEFERLDRDVFAAVTKIASAGATKVVLVGASMGGTASLIAAAELFAGQTSTGDHPSVDITVAGVATLSAPVSFKGLSAQQAVSNIHCPLLFIAAEKDVGASGAVELEHLSGNTGDLEIVSGKDHGTNLLTGSQAEKVYGLLLSFLEKALPEGGQ